MFGQLEEADSLIEDLCRDKVQQYQFLLLSPFHVSTPINPYWFIPVPGPPVAPEWCVHHSHGLLWLGQQQSYTTPAAHCCEPKPACFVAMVTFPSLLGERCRQRREESGRHVLGLHSLQVMMSLRCHCHKSELVYVFVCLFVVVVDRTPEQCPHVVSLLSESFNPHVRCGAAMALGVACASTGNKVGEGVQSLWWHHFLFALYFKFHSFLFFSRKRSHSSNQC